VGDDAFDGPDRRGQAPRGRRSEDLVGWRLGQLELEVTRIEEAIVRLDHDLVKRTSVQQHDEVERDWTIRVLVAAIAVLQLGTNVVLLLSR
jgi:hypothetical protein